MNADLSLVGGFMTQLPANAPGKAVEDDPVIGASLMRMGDLNVVAGSWLQSGTAPAVTAIGE